MDKEENRIRCPFPMPISIKEDPSEAENDAGGAWQATESYPKLRLIRTPISPCHQRSNVNKNRKIKRISTPSPSLLQAMDKSYAAEMNYVNGLQTTFKNNIDRMNVDFEKKLTQKMTDMDEKLRCSKLKKWCPVCLKELTVDSGFDPSACSIECWKLLLMRDGYYKKNHQLVLNQPEKR